MTERTATVRNAHGIHCRPSALIIQGAADFHGSIEVTAESGATNLKSIIELIGLGLGEGSTVSIRVEGANEVAFCDTLVELFERHFDFPRE